MSVEDSRMEDPLRKALLAPDRTEVLRRGLAEIIISTPQATEAFGDYVRSVAQDTGDGQLEYDVRHIEGER